MASLRLGHLPPFNWELFKLGSVSLRDIRKNVPNLQVGGSSPVPPTPLVIRLYLLHKVAILLNPLIPQLYLFKIISYLLHQFQTCDIDQNLLNFDLHLKLN